MEVGDIFECLIQDKYYYIQYISEDDLGLLFKVFYSGFYKKQPFSTVGNSSSYYAYLLASPRLLKKNGFIKVFNVLPSNRPTLFKRAGAPDPKTWAPTWWSLVENGKEIKRYTELPSQFRSLPNTENINIPLLLDRLKEGWNPIII